MGKCELPQATDDETKIRLGEWQLLGLEAAQVQSEAQSCALSH